MTTDVWRRVSERITRLWRGVQPERVEAITAGLEADREEVLAATEAGDEEALNELCSQWQGRLRRLLVAHPGALEELRHLLEEFAPAGAPPAPDIVQHATASGQARIYQAGRDQHITER